MKKKILILAVILCIFAVTQAHAIGFGAQLNFSAGEIFAPGFSLLLSPSKVTHLAANWYLDFDEVNIVGLTFDVCPISLPLVSTSLSSFNFTLGLGVFTNLVFTEELAAKIGDFRVIAAGYFSALPIEQITQIDEETAKREILRRFNENLRLGRITELYFTDLMILSNDF